METFWKFIIEGNPFSEKVIRSFFITFKVSPRDVSKSQFDTLKCSIEELAILKAVTDNPKITQDELKEVIGKSLATVKRITISLQEKGFLVRKNGKRNGYWEII